MAAITGFTYTMVKRRKTDASPSCYENTMSLAFGDGSTLTYPTGGIPVVKGLLGLPNNIESLVFSNEDSASGFVYKFDSAASKIKMFQVPASSALTNAAPLVEVVNTATPSGTLIVIAKGY